MYTEDLQFAEPPMSISGILIPGAVVGELDVGIFVRLAAVVIATEVMDMSIASMMKLYIRSAE